MSVEKKNWIFFIKFRIRLANYFSLLIFYCVRKKIQTLYLQNVNYITNQKHLKKCKLQNGCVLWLCLKWDLANNFMINKWYQLTDTNFLPTYCSQNNIVFNHFIYYFLEQNKKIIFYLRQSYKKIIVPGGIRSRDLWITGRARYRGATPCGRRRDARLTTQTCLFLNISP